jgi:mRNA interferase RelE/StbE
VAYSVSLTPAAERQFRKLPSLLQQRLKPHVDSLAENPRPPQVVKLHGEPNLYRIRVGEYRIVHYVWDTEQEVMIAKIAHRREVYR